MADIVYRSDCSSQPSDPCGGKQPCPVCGGLHHWETERISALRTSPGELSVIPAPSLTPQHLSVTLTDSAVTDSHVQLLSPDTLQLLPLKPLKPLSITLVHLLAGHSLRPPYFYFSI